MNRTSCTTLVVLALAACRGSSLSSTSQEVVTTVPEQARQVDMTIYATRHHSSNHCWCTIANEFTHNHAGACTNHWRHGGQWRMNWEAYCERAENADCSESYPVVTGGRQAERSTWVGANEHWESIASPVGIPGVDWGSCAKWTWDGSWEGANFCQGQSRGMVAASEGSGSPNVFVAAGVGYAMRHGEDQLTVTPSVVIGVGQGGVGAGAGAGLDFSFRDQSWGNGYEIRCQYRCNWSEASMEVTLQEKCWAVGWETSDENPTSGGASHAEAGLTIDNMWHDLRRQRCTTEEPECGSGGCSVEDAAEPDAEEIDAAEPDAAEPDAGIDAPDSDGGIDCEHLCDISAEACEAYCTDAGIDAPIDAEPDAPADASPDAPVDASPDAPVDAAIDAWMPDAWMTDAWMPDAPWMTDAGYQQDAQP